MAAEIVIYLAHVYEQLTDKSKEQHNRSISSRVLSFCCYILFRIVYCGRTYVYAASAREETISARLALAAGWLQEYLAIACTRGITGKPKIASGRIHIVFD